jgi:SecD/SecF fusion protein
VSRFGRALTSAALAGLCLAGCGGNDGNGGRPVATTTARRQGATTRLVFAARPPVDATAMAKTIAVMRARLRGVAAAGATVTGAGGRIEVSIPDGRNAAIARQQVGTTGKLVFYDWETNVVGPDGRTAPHDQDVTGGVPAGQPGTGTSQSQYRAVVQASRLRPVRTTTGTWYGVDRRARAVLCGPQDTEREAREVCSGAGKRPTSYVEVPAGYVVVRSEAEADDAQAMAAAADAYFLLRDRPALTGRDITDPGPDVDPTSAAPVVTFGFTRAGARRWRRMTRAISERGAAALRPGADSTSVANHFAIALDDQLVSVPFIDPSSNPHGIDAANGSEISGGFSRRSARDLAGLLKTGTLPLHLDLIATEKTG